MVTGRVKFLKCIAGLMIMEKMEENSFRKRSRLGLMKQRNISPLHPPLQAGNYEEYEFMKSDNNSSSLNIAGKIKDYLKLIKLSLSIMVVFSSVLAYLLVPGIEESYVNPLRMTILLAIGGLLVTGSANAINQAVEKDTDAMMKRTSDRPVAAGRMSVTEAWVFAIVAGAVGIFILGYYFNWTAAALAALSLFLYAFVYTPLKKVNAIAVLVGAFPGALPCLIGWAAGDESLGIGGWVLFGIQFLWQFPHFWARSEERRVGIGCRCR